MVLNAIDTKALVAACSHNKLEPNENGQYNVQEFTFKVKLGFQSNNCLDLFNLDIKERKGDDEKNMHVHATYTRTLHIFWGERAS